MPYFKILSSRWIDSFFLPNIICCACLARSGLNFIFHWKALSLIFSTRWLRSFAEVSMSWTIENKDVSSANNLHLLLISFDESLIYIKNNKDPKMDLCGTPSWMSAQDYHWSFKTTLCFLSLRKSSKILIISLEIPFWCSLKISPSSHEIRGPYQKHLRFHD